MNLQYFSIPENCYLIANREIFWLSINVRVCMYFLPNSVSIVSISSNDRANEPANSNVNSVTGRMEWHAIVGETFAEFPSHRSAFYKEEESRKIRPSLSRLHARWRHAHSDLAYRDLSRNFANFDAEEDKDRHYCYASRIENFLISHQPRSILRFPGLNVQFNGLFGTKCRIAETLSSPKLSKNYQHKKMTLFFRQSLGIFLISFIPAVSLDLFS